MILLLIPQPASIEAIANANSPIVYDPIGSMNYKNIGNSLDNKNIIITNMLIHDIIKSNNIGNLYKLFSKYIIYKDNPLYTIELLSMTFM